MSWNYSRLEKDNQNRVEVTVPGGHLGRGLLPASTARLKILIIHCIVLDDKLLQSCLTLCNPVDCSPSGSSVRGILQTRIPEWVAMSSSKGSSQQRDWTYSLMSPALAGEFFTTSASWEAPKKYFGVHEKVLPQKCRIISFILNTPLASTKNLNSKTQNGIIVCKYLNYLPEKKSEIFQGLQKYWISKR